MAKLYDAVGIANKKGRSTKTTREGNRLFDALDMAIIKHDEAVHNAELKRGEKVKGKKHVIYACGCGGSGCCLHVEVK